MISKRPGYHLGIVKAILCKTVARGATVGEEAAAVDKAVQLMRKYDIPVSAVASKWPKGWQFDGQRSIEKPKRPEPKPMKTTPYPSSGWNAGTIGDYARQLLMREMANLGPYSYQWIIEAVKIRYPNAKTTVASLRWYENELRKQGRKVPTNRPAK